MTTDHHAGFVAKSIELIQRECDYAREDLAAGAFDEALAWIDSIRVCAVITIAFTKDPS